MATMAMAPNLISTRMKNCPAAELRSEIKEKKKKVIVVGGGVGGLAVGARLAKQGLDVEVLEKNKEAGGRLQSMEATIEGFGGSDELFRFDTGPSLLLLPVEYREFFACLGENMEDYITLKRVEPAAYRVFFAERGEPTYLDILYDVQAMCQQLDKVEAGASTAYLRFLSNAREALDKGTENFIRKDFRTFWEFANFLPLLPILKRLSPFELLGQHYSCMRSYFNNSKLLALFTFQDLYVGLTPYTAPGVFSLLAATEITDGIWYPIGGFGKVRDGFIKVAKKVGVKIHCNATVKSIDHQNGKVIGVTLSDGSSLKADIIVANADLPYTCNELLNPKEGKTSFIKPNFNYSAGIISFNWCLSCQLKELAHHNVFISDCYEKSWERAKDADSLSQGLNFYVHAPSRTDSSASPPGGDAITILLPVANLKEGYPRGTKLNLQIIDSARKAVLQRFKCAGIGDIESKILKEIIYSPPSWESMYNLYNGAAFGLSHNLSQLAYFRPDVSHPTLMGLYFVGASTRPGNGVPLVLMGSKTTSERILEDLVCKLK